jgi:hypothetical protein
MREYQTPKTNVEEHATHEILMDISEWEMRDFVFLKEATHGNAMARPKESKK